MAITRYSVSHLIQKICLSAVQWHVQSLGKPPNLSHHLSKFSKVTSSVFPSILSIFLMPLALFVINLVFSALLALFQQTSSEKSQFDNSSAAYDRLSIMFFHSIRHIPFGKNADVADRRHHCLTQSVFWSIPHAVVQLNNTYPCHRGAQRRKPDLHWYSTSARWPSHVFLLLFTKMSIDIDSEGILRSTRPGQAQDSSSVSALPIT